MKSILISIKPKWCKLIASGKKTIEVRKTRPKCDTPFKCYIYCTKDKGISFWTGKRYAYADDRSHNLFDVCGNGKVIGEFICNKTDRLTICGYDNSNTELRRVDNNFAAYDLDCDYLNKCQLSLYELKNYNNGNGLCGWHISDLVIYDKPKDIDDFMSFGKSNCNQKNCRDCLYLGIDGECDIKDVGQPITRPPQSWCYVEEVEE